MELRLKVGRGYVSADRNYDDDLALGFIPIDSVHSPVRKVNYTVEAARLGQTTDYDKLTLEVWTNGAVAPADALGLAAKLLKDHMTIFINFEEALEGGDLADSRPGRLQNDNLNRSVEELELSVRSYNCLKTPTSRPSASWCRSPKRNAQDQELRPQVAQRDQGILHTNGPRPGHAD